jgi:hydroxyacylglutathione hydrolase
MNFKTKSIKHVYCGHEYSVSNLKYALHVEPSNSAARDKLNWAEKQRAGGLRTIPSTLAEELAYNPFMRCGVVESMRKYGCEDAVSCMQAMRKEKDNWKPT